MPAHWTYADVEPAADLAQGDVIEPTSEIREILQNVHPHFLDPKYVAFVVLSQSCDLVRRPRYRGQPINLCVVRELRSIAGTLLELYCGSDIPNVFCNEDRGEARKFLERIINQNEQTVGLFYLHPDADAGVSTSSVAMLRIAIALRTEHYELIQKARRGRLRSEFQAKLGWLIGNLYSRVGTEDWSESTARKKEQKGIIDQVIENLVGIEWTSSHAATRAKHAGFDAQGKTPEQIRSELAAFEPVPLDKQLLKGIERILQNQDLGLPPEIQAKIVKRLPNDAELAQLLRQMRRG